MKDSLIKANLHAELLAHRERSINEGRLLELVGGILRENDRRREEIRDAIETSEGYAENTLRLELLETNRIVHLDQIRRLCIEYRLRFLPSSYFKDAIPPEAVSRIRELETSHGVRLRGFGILAPGKAFRLRRYDDPLLFAHLGNGYFYLIHQWGDELNRSRKWLMWPFRNLGTFVTASVLLSIVVTLLLPETSLSRAVPMAQAIVFLFVFKSIFAVAMYSFFLLGKKFSGSVWDSFYFNH